MGQDGGGWAGTETSCMRRSLQAAAPFPGVANIFVVVTVIIAATALRDCVGNTVISGMRHGHRVV